MYLKSLIDQIHEELTGFEINDDSKYDYDYIKDKLIGFNVSLIREAWEKKNNLEPYMRMVDCIRIVRAGIECTINGITFDKKHGCLYTAEVNHLIDTGFENISYFGSPGLTGQFSRKNMIGFLMANSHPYPKNTVFTVIGDTIILKNLPDTGTRIGTIVGLFEDVTKCCNWPSNDEAEFPTPSIQKLTYLVKRDIMAQGPRDLVHDAQGVLAQTKPQPSNEE